MIIVVISIFASYLDESTNDEVSAQMKDKCKFIEKFLENIKKILRPSQDKNFR